MKYYHLLLTAALSLLAFNSCQDNATPESDPVELEAIASEFTGAYVRDMSNYSSDTDLTLVLTCDGLDYWAIPIFKHISIDLNFPGEVTELQIGTYKSGDSILEEAYFSYGDFNSHLRTGADIPSVTLEISKSGDDYTITFNGSFGFGPEISATYTGPIEYVDWETWGHLASGSFEAGGFSGSVESAYVWNCGYREESDYTRCNIYIHCDPSEGQEKSNYFDLIFYFPGKIVGGIPTGTYELNKDQSLILGRFYYNNGSSYWPQIVFETLTIEISKTGDEYNIKASGTFEDGTPGSLDFTGRLIYRPNY